MYLAGDVGGTKTNVALFTESDLQIVERRSFPSGQYPGLEPIIEEFLEGKRVELSGACFGVAGPVVGGKSSITNLTWVLCESELRRFLNVPRFSLINDLEANGYGIPVLPESALHTLQEGTPVTGNGALISAGTGLGECALFWNGSTHIPSASEGGHSTFAPRNDEEIELLGYLLRFHPHISWERVVSGSMGVKNIYDFLRDTGRASEPPELAAEIESGDAAAAISAAADRGVEIAERTMNLFVTLYGAEAGNLALKLMAVNGVYIGGGIAPKILPRMKTGGFLEAFRHKGRFTSMLENIPVKVILDSDAALHGAANCARLRSR